MFGESQPKNNKKARNSSALKLLTFSVQHLGTVKLLKPIVCLYNVQKVAPTS
jgi:hypothetical protein